YPCLLEGLSCKLRPVMGLKKSLAISEVQPLKDVGHLGDGLHQQCLCCSPPQRWPTTSVEKQPSTRASLQLVRFLADTKPFRVTNLKQLSRMVHFQNNEKGPGIGGITFQISASGHRNFCSWNAKLQSVIGLLRLNILVLSPGGDTTCGIHLPDIRK